MAYVERDRDLHVAADPLDTIDPLTSPPIKYTWFYDDCKGRAMPCSRRAAGRAGRSP